jgi:hypothetical protein
MGTLFPIGEYTLASEIGQNLIDDVPLCGSLREAVELMIRAIHGLPEAIGAADLKQIVVYLGRAGTTPTHVRNRWEHRLTEFSDAPSAHAMVVARGRTAQIRRERWEDAGNRIIRSLDGHGALCVANARLGSAGPWPETRETVLYLVVRRRRGPSGGGVDPARLKEALIDLLDDDSLDDAVARQVRLVAKPEEAAEHQIFDEWDLEDTDEDDASEKLCRKEGCSYRALPGNYGFCGRHR